MYLRVFPIDINEIIKSLCVLVLCCLLLLLFSSFLCCSCFFVFFVSWSVGFFKMKNCSNYLHITKMINLITLNLSNQILEIFFC